VNMPQLDPVILASYQEQFVQASKKYGDLCHGAICTDDPGLQQLLKFGDVEEAARFWREALELAEIEGDEAGRIVFVGVGLGEVKPIEIGKAEWLGRMFNPGIVDKEPYRRGHYDPLVEHLPGAALTHFRNLAKDTVGNFVKPDPSIVWLEVVYEVLKPEPEVRNFDMGEKAAQYKLARLPRNVFASSAMAIEILPPKGSETQPHNPKDAGNGENGVMPAGADLASRESELEPADKKAYFAFSYAEYKGHTKTDKEAYDWLQEIGLPNERESPSVAAALAGYVLPKYETWVRKLRNARKVLGRQKNISRSGRATESGVARGDEVEYQHGGGK
jgi:hypothetical protein